MAVTHAAGELHEARADEVADALRVVHDARDQHAGLRRVEVAHGQPHDVLFDAPAHVGDRLLRGDAEDLREPERRDAPARPWRPAAIQASVGSSSMRPLPTTSSIRYLESDGSTKPGARLTSISTSPSASRQRRAQMSARASCQAADQRIFFFLGFGHRRGASARRARSPSRSRLRGPVITRSGRPGSRHRAYPRSGAAAVSLLRQLDLELPDDLALDRCRRRCAAGSPGCRGW